MKLATLLAAVLFASWVSSCASPDPGAEAGPCDPRPEECNGLDDDCDGEVDEAESGGPLRRNCSNACGAGEEECDDGEWLYCSAPQPSAELCNGEDDNCDGRVDEGCQCLHGERRECGEAIGECGVGVQYCDSGEWGDCQLPYDPTELEELCGDGLDNDCDGETDEICTCDPGTTQPCGTDEGECRAGLMACQADATWDNTCVGEVGPEIDFCDGLDNDCDGGVDSVLATDFLWQSDVSEPNNTCAEATPIYNVSGALEVNEGGDVVRPAVSNPEDLTTYPSLYALGTGFGDEDWYHTVAVEQTDCWNPFGNDCAFVLNAQLLLLDREYVGGVEQNPEDYRLCVTVGDCTSGTELCTHGTNWYEEASLYQLSIIWGSPCYSRRRSDIYVQVSSPTGLACGYYQVYLWLEFDDELECP